MVHSTNNCTAHTVAVHTRRCLLTRTLSRRLIWMTNASKRMETAATAIPTMTIMHFRREK